MKISQIKISETLTFSFVGPPLEAGPLKTVFYFALSAQDSLETDPYNQPVRFLYSDDLRIFTVTIPGHEEGLRPESAIQVWAKKMEGGMDVLSPFFKSVKHGIDSLLEKNLILDEKLGVMGLSRGAFVASHIAALSPNIHWILGFAPLCRLSTVKDFQSTPHAPILDLETLIPKLYHKVIRFYIGNQDKRVGTEHAFQLIYQLATEAKRQRIHSPPLELIIGPSIGYLGHGTAPHVFQAGVDWIRKMWRKTDE